MIRAVLFDMDGILYDSEYFYMNGTIEQMKRYGYDGPVEDIYAIMGTSMEDTYLILYRLLGGKVPLDEIRKNNEHYFQVEHPLHFREIMFPGLKEELRKLKDMGIRMAVCSSSPIDLIHDSLKEMDVDSLFDFVESGDNVQNPKPAPDIYLLAQKELGVAKEECIVYEDSTLGIEAGKRAGIFTVAREDNRFLQDQSHADKKVKDIQSLVEWIRKENSHA